MVENVSPRQSWKALLADPAAQLVDVRTTAEWSFVGVPDLGEAGKKPLLIEWQAFPAMQVNPRFVEQLREAGVSPETPLYFLCRSGGRSMMAAQAAAAAGFTHAFNIADGFEGAPDPTGHRGTVSGWKAEGLPWRQG